MDEGSTPSKREARTAAVRSRLRNERIGHAALAALAFIALVVLVLVPPGYMVGGADQSGPVRIVICTGHGPVEAAVDLGKTPPTKNGKASTPCSISAHASAAPISVPPSIAAAWPLETALITFPGSRSFIGRGLAAPPPARAPPISLT
jgi:hypothetical protein